MSIYTSGINGDNACVLFALDAMFGDAVDWGKEFLIEYYEECGSIGFPQNDFYLIEESAPIKLLQYGSFTINYLQPALYTYIYDKNNNIRYRIQKDTLIMLAYGADTWSHAVAIPSREIIVYLIHYQFHAIILPKHGLLIDNRTYEQDIKDGIIKA